MAEEKRGKRRWSRSSLVGAAVGLVVVAAGVAIWVRGPDSDEERPEERAAPPVELAAVTERTLDETVRGVGTLRASESVQITPESAGRVRTIHFQEGGRVDEGDILIELDDEKLRRELAARQASLRAGEVRVANAERTFRRQKQLAERGAVAEDEYDQAEAELESALADVERFEAERALVAERLGDMVIRAPFDGAISEREIDRGAYVSVGEPLARLYQTDPLEIIFSVPERYMGRIRSGQEVRVSVAAYPDNAFEGTVDFISPSIEEATRTLRLKAVVSNPDGVLNPGASAAATVTVDRREDQPVIPEEALVATRRGYLVFVVDEDRVAHSREVRTGLRQEGMVQIVDGLETGEMVVRAGHMRIDDGQRVEVVNADEGETAGPLAGQGGR